jgi:hypothetical protein
MKLSKRAHTKSSEVNLSPNMCVAIADADALSRGDVVPEDSPLYNGNTFKAVAKRGIFHRLRRLTTAPYDALTPYGKHYVPIAIEHFMVRHYEQKRGSK